MTSNYQRVYATTDGCNCTPTPLVQDTFSGRLQNTGNTGGTGAITLQQAQALGVPVYNRSAFIGSGGLQLAQSLTVKATETASGGLATYREEMGGGDGSAVVAQWTTTLVNSGASAVVVPFGDGNKWAELGLALPAIPVTIAVTGTAGANSLAQFKLMTSNNPVRIQTLRLNASSAGVLASSVLETVTANSIGELVRKNSNLGTWLNTDQFNTALVQNKDFRFIVDGQSCILLTVPVGTLTFTMDIVSIARSYGMVSER